MQLEKFVGSVADIRHGLPPAQAVQYAMELEEYAISNHRHVVPGRTRFECADEFRASDDEDEQVRSTDLVLQTAGELGRVSRSLQRPIRWPS